MSDGAIYTIGMFLLGPVILLILMLVGRSASRRGRQEGASSERARPAMRWGCAMLLLMPVSAFCGLMVATAGGALHPRLVTAAAPYVCDGTVETQSRGYSYKPGQQGIARNIFCIAPDGERRDITLRAIGAATIYYTLIFFPIVLLLGMVALRTIRSRLADMSKGLTPRGMADLKAFMADRLRVGADIVRHPTAAQHASVEDRLHHLQSLRDGGLISEVEYQAKRAEILAGL